MKNRLVQIISGDGYKAIMKDQGAKDIVLFGLDKKGSIIPLIFDEGDIRNAAEPGKLIDICKPKNKK